MFDLYILYNCFFLIYYVSIVIDPRFKLGYYQKQEWEQYYIDAAKKIFTDTFKNLYQDNIDDTNNRENTNNESDFLFNILGGNNNNDYNEAEAYGVSAGKRDQIEIFFKKKFLSKIDVDLIIWSRTFIISKKNFLSIWSLFPALTPYFLM